jgi:hypothetical protein
VSFNNSTETIYKADPTTSVELSFNPDKAVATQIIIVSHVGVAYIDDNNLTGKTFTKV